MTTRKYPDVRTKGTVEVTGTVIAEARSETRPGGARYTKIDVFRLEDQGSKPAWCVVTVGVSRIFHDGSEPCRSASGRPYGQKATWDDLVTLEDALYANDADDADYYSPCKRCLPDGDPHEIDGGDPIYIEKDKARIQVVHTGAELYDALCGWDPKRNVKFMSDVGNSAWMQVQGCDPDVGEHTVKVS